MESKNSLGVRLLSSLLEKIDTWKKLGIFIVLLIISGGGYFIYIYQNEFFFLTLNALEIPEIDRKKIDTEAIQLIRETNAISVVVWEIEFESNRREAIYINIDGVRDNRLVGTGDLIFKKKAKLTEVIIELLVNETACSEVNDDSSVSMALVNAGVTYICLVSIPPSYKSIVGIISLGFATKPVNEDYIRRELLQVAENLTK
ncbi:hypothetical protein [Yersinia enterocolitica]|uniref:hypothetical protein n=1 Tax=Yersinia enterocolitica TaxID=630 RepID=UPI003CFF4CEE